jgi:universal stress protein A
MSRVKRLLMPTDFSPTSDIAFEYALDLAAREGASMHLLHVIDDANFSSAYPEGLSLALPGLWEQIVAEAWKRLEQASGQCQTEGVRTTTQVLAGRPAPSIAGEAAAQSADLIVMGTHGRGGFAHFVIGSVAESVVRTAECPVLTVRDSSRAADIVAAEAVMLGQAAVA